MNHVVGYKEIGRKDVCAHGAVVHKYLYFHIFQCSPAGHYTVTSVLCSASNISVGKITNVWKSAVCDVTRGSYRSPSLCTQPKQSVCSALRCHLVAVLMSPIQACTEVSRY